jgi:hypothetical protein
MLSIRQSLATSLSSLFDCAASYDNFCFTYLARTGTWKEETTADYVRPALNPIRPPPTYWAIEGGAPAWSNAHTDSGGTPVDFSVVRGLKVSFWGPGLSKNHEGQEVDYCTHTMRCMNLARNLTN